MKDRIRQILREEVSDKKTKLISAMVDPTNTNPKLDRWRKKFIDDEGTFDLALANEKDLYDGDEYQFGKDYPDVPYHYIDGHGDKGWFINGKLNRGDDKPAIVWENGTEDWYKDDKRHRVGKPASIRDDGGEVWYENNELHRIGGPALTDPEYGRKEWFVKGLRHNEEGPAISRRSGDGVDEAWYINNNEVAFKGHNDDYILVKDDVKWWKYFDKMYPDVEIKRDRR